MRTIESKILPLCLLSFILCFSCEPTGPEGSCPACPIIISIEPDHGREGDEVTITGSNFDNFIDGQDKVTINGKEALLTNVPRPTSLQVPVPSQAGSGPVVVQIGELSSLELGPSLNFIYDEVRVDSLRPSQAKMGEVLTIFGVFFDELEPRNNEVIFPNDSVAEVLEVTETALKIRVPKGAGSGSITVSVDGITVSIPDFEYIRSATVETFSGVAGQPGSSDKGSGQFFLPYAIAIDDKDNIYVCDLNGLRKINPQNRTVTTQINSRDSKGSLRYSFTGILVNENGTFLSETITDKVGKQGGLTNNLFLPLTIKHELVQPYGLAADDQGNIFCADKNHNQIVKISPSNKTTTFGNSLISIPDALVFDLEGNLLVSENGSGLSRIQMISPEGQVSTLIGGTKGYSVEGTILFKGITGMDIDSKGNVFVADSENNSIRMISPDRAVFRIAGGPKSGMADGDGDKDALFSLPFGVAVDSQDNLYVADGNNHVIRKITFE